jgi:WD40 repeat protein
VLTAQFSPDMQFLVSIGFQHDGFIYVWEWKTRKRICGAKITTPLFSLAFDPQSHYFVTTGAQHIKFWNLKNIREKMSSINMNKESAASLLSSEAPSLFSLEGRAGLLGEHKGATLVDVCCLESIVEGVPQSLTYAMTLNGYVLMFNASGVLEKWLHAKMEKGSCIRATSAYIICGGSDGKVRLFEPATLKHLGNIAPPEPLLITVSK